MQRPVAMMVKSRHNRTAGFHLTRTVPAQAEVSGIEGKKREKATSPT
jgi:hypothetical protein